MGYKDVKIVNVTVSSNNSSAAAMVNGITANHVMMNDDFPGADIDINWETGNGYVELTAPRRVIDGVTILNPDFGFNATLTCVLGIPD